jgi:DNA-binding transcriptional LysR family regulator
MHLDRLDLNLLVLFRALALHRTVTLSANALGISPSAVSHALSRLRHHYDDPLFVRVGAKMELTDRAKEIAPTIEKVLASIQTTFESNFSPSSLERQFRIGLVHFGGLYVLPALLGKLATEAPRSRLAADHLSESVAFAQLEHREIDLIIGLVNLPRRDLVSITLFVDQFRIVVKKKHPVFEKRVSADDLSAMEHIRIPFFDWIEPALAKQGLKRKFGLSTDNLLSALSIVGRSTLVAIMPNTIPRIYAGVFGVRSLPPPIIVPPCVVDLVYHRRSENDAGHKWLREAICGLAIEIGSAMGTAKQLMQRAQSGKTRTGKRGAR